MPPRIKNFGTGTPKLNEGIIVSGSDDQNYAIYASGSVHAEMLLLDTTLPVIQFKEGGSDRAEILINNSDNLVITNQSSNRHIVFKANDAGTVREGLRLDGAVPEVVVNQTQDSLVNFRVESENNTHMLFVTGSDKVGIGTSDPQSELHVKGTLLLSGSAGTELLRLSKGNAETREIVFENDGTDIASIFCNAAESLRLKSEKLNGSIVFQVNSGGTIENLMFLDGGNLRVGINTATPSAALDVVGDVATSGQITAATQPAFLARKPSNNQDQFAVGSGVDVTLSTEDFDVGSNFASNTFTAPTTGVYIFTANIYLVDLDTDANYYALDLVTTAGTYRLAAVDPGGFSNDLTQYILGGSIPLSLAAGDTAKIQVYQSGGTQQTSIRGAGTRGTFFAGYLLG